MARLIGAGRIVLVAATMIAAFMSIGVGDARAALAITNTTVNDQYQITEAGGCPGGCIPIGQTGFIVGSNDPASAPNITVTPGTYTFIYKGAGDSVDDNMFQVTGLNPITMTSETDTFCSQAFLGCNGGVKTPIGSSFTLVLGAGDIPFIFTADFNGETGCSVSNSSTTNAVPNSGCADYFLSVGNSTGTPVNNGGSPGVDGPTPLTGPAVYGYIGLTDGQYPGDYDFQDLAVQVVVPEPGTLAILGIGLAGMLAARRRRALR